MLAPLSWLKEYVDITLTPEKLSERLTEVGLNTEKITKSLGDTILEIEITPNRPDCLSLIGVAREVAAIEGTKAHLPKLKTDLKPTPKTNILPLKIHLNYDITPRITGIIINNVTVSDSPKWLQEKLLKIGQKPINNIVDITNYVMKELGNPIHSFDYHTITSSEMWVKQTKGGEVFESVDEITYHLPKGAIVLEDTDKIFDLVGIKGGKNSGTYAHTKAVLIIVPVDDPVLIRRASQALALRSDASAIFERNVNRGGTLDALKRTVDLILEMAGGEIASELFDVKKGNFEPWKLELRLDRLKNILGIEIPQKKIVEILDSLNLSPKVKGNVIETPIPTYRNDLKIEEDLIEEVARVYGYNNFPKTMPSGQVPTTQIPYFKNYRVEEKVKEIMKAAGFSEIYTYSLISEQEIQSMGLEPKNILRVDNSVSREYEYLRPSLRSNVLKAIQQNKGFETSIHVFEIGKIYTGKSIDNAHEEFVLSGISNKKNFYEIKGLLEYLFEEFNIKTDEAKYIEILPQGVFFEIPYSLFTESTQKEKVFKPLPKYPAITEDISIIISHSVKTGDVIEEIKKLNTLITHVSLLDTFEDTRTFHIIYQHQDRNLTTSEVAEIRTKILSHLKEKCGAIHKS